MNSYSSTFGNVFARCIVISALVNLLALSAVYPQQTFDLTRGMVLHGTIVTMDTAGAIVQDGNVLVRSGMIVAIWRGKIAPIGTPVGNAIAIELGAQALIFPGLINLHNHPTYDVLDPWPAPSSDVQSGLGRPLGTEPYANRYQWNNVSLTSPPEYRRLVDTPQLILTLGLGLTSEIVKYSEIKAMLGGETAFQDGLPDPATDNLMIRNVTDMTVIVQGNGLEDADFAAMRAAPSIRLDGTGDGLGAKLVWSPLSNLLLYGQTALVYHALKEGVTVSLGTDWSPSGSRNLLDELKIADIALRDSRLLGLDRDIVPNFSIKGKSGDARRLAEIALDKQLVEMVTSNPAKTLRWSQKVGSIETGKFADLVVITRPSRRSARDVPDSPYRNLIDATEGDVRLVLVNGEPRSGDVDLMAALKPNSYEIAVSECNHIRKGIDVTNPALPKGTETFAYLQQTLGMALTALGGDNPSAGGGPADNSNTYSYLKANIPGAAALTDAQFRGELAFFAGLVPDGRLNLEGIQLSPILVESDHFFFHLLGGDVSGHTGLIADDMPPFGLYPANLNQIQGDGNPFDEEEYRDRYFERCVEDP
jgi:5-methylthioadenosine/S-adenosylhomocysteine deaminase